jgi:hypothetical protein
MTKDLQAKLVVIFHVVLSIPCSEPFFVLGIVLVEVFLLVLHTLPFIALLDTRAVHARDLAATMLAATMGLAFDIDKDRYERKRIFRASGRMIKTMNVTQSETGDKGGLWTSVVAAAVLVP